MSDDEEQFNAKTHKQLLQAISSLGKNQHIRKSTRDEPKLQQDEFQLVKVSSVEEKVRPVRVNDIVNILKGTQKHLKAGKQLKNVSMKKVLKRPLERPAAERIKRTIGYENVKKKLAKWDAIVAKNRSAETQVFPLKGETIYVNTSLKRQPLQQSIKSDLMLEMEELENKYAQLKREQMGDTEDPKELEKREEELLKKKLTKEELIAKRRELAYLKMRESQKSAKARLQNKIKSKKYHKLLKKQKMQEQIKQFELLQKTNPEAALEKLNALEKSRVLERASLRHKNTGTWAKNLQIRAKYDKDVRKDLSEQLQISRQLTQKINDEDEESENENDENKKINNTSTAEDEDMDYDPFNPWTKVGRNSKRTINPAEDEKANWRKYWLDRNDNEKMMEEYKRLLEDDEKVGEKEDNDEVNHEEIVKSIETIHKNKPTNEKPKHKNTKILKKNPIVENGWVVEELDFVTTKSIDDIFDTQEDKIKENLSKELEIINEKVKKLKNSNIKPSKRLRKSPDALKNLKDLSFKNETSKPEIDEELTNELDDKKRDNIDANEILQKAKRLETAPNEKNSKSIDDIFDIQEDKIKENLSKKLEIINEKVKKLKNSNIKLSKHLRKSPDALKNLKDLSFKNEISKPEIDEELTNELDDKKQDNIDANEILQKAKRLEMAPNEKNNKSDGLIESIDPNKLAVVKLNLHKTGFGTISDALDDVDMDEEDELDANVQQQMAIAQAFEDDDIIEDFSKDKTKDSEVKDAELQLSMPGWGSWAGAGISKEQIENSNKRLLLKLAPKEKRRDDNKDGVYINEKASKQLRSHLVSDIPFPFTSLKDYEASIRAPIGRNFVTETAFRLLTRPSVITQKGKIIEPMDESELFKPQRKLRNPIDIRIGNISNTNTN